MQIIGIVGGIASGKSVVAAEFVALGAGRLDADRATHEVLADPQVRDAIVGRWGAAVLGADDAINRGKLAEIVFGETRNAALERKFLEQLTHPKIASLIENQMASLTAEGVDFAVLDAPLLLEAGWDTICDKIVFVEAPAAVREGRTRSRGWSPEEWRRREAAQASLAQKRAAADAVIDNGGDFTATRACVRELWEQWT